MTHFCRVPLAHLMVVSLQNVEEVLTDIYQEMQILLGTIQPITQWCSNQSMYH